MTSSILIVGTGSMGVAHMHAFKKSKDKQIIYLLDKKKKIEFIKKTYKFNMHKKIIYLTKIPKRKVL
jgi:pyrroline-5-carboxylate reductase